MLIFFVRHGDPCYDPDSLTKKGLAQADALATRFAKGTLDDIYASPLKRACQTAEPTAKALGKEAIVLPWLSEAHAWEMLTTDRDGRKTWLYASDYYRKLFLTKDIYDLGDKWYESNEVNKALCKQAVTEMRENVTNLLKQYGYVYEGNTKTYSMTNECDNNKRIAIFAHEGIGMLFLSTLLNIPYPQYCTHFCLGHSGVTVIELAKDGELIIPRVLQHSNDSHLYQQGLPTDYQNRIDI